MWSGPRAAVIASGVLSLGACVAASPTPPASRIPASEASTPPPTASSPASSDAAGLRVRVEVSTAGVAVNGRAASSDRAALKATLEEVDGAAIDVQARSDAPAALVLAALTVDAGPHVTRRLLSWQDVRLDVSEHHSPSTTELGQAVPASIFSWHSGGTTQLWSVSTGPTVTNLGPFEPGDAQAEPAAISNLTNACAATGCRIVAELREEGLLDALRAWQHVIAAVGPRLGLEVKAPPPPPPPNLERRAFGHLPPELIQRVIRLGFGRFKSCYEGGLARDPKLEGRVSVRFVIERDGTVHNSTDSGSDIPDTAVRDCVVHEFLGFKFPAPETGIVTVVYPIMLAPG